LETLYLGGSNVSLLPDSIGDLTNLEELFLFESNISLIPATIGHLKNLERLMLRDTTTLKNLPDEIGGATNLKYLNLNGTIISSIPGSIGNLKNLKVLELGKVRTLKRLPDEIGDATSLEQICLRDTSISSLPVSLCKLKHLRRLVLSGSPVLESLKPNPILVHLAKQCPSLECIETIYSLKGDIESKKKRQHIYQDLIHQLTFNMVSKRIIILRNYHNIIPPGLWPLILKKAERAQNHRAWYCRCRICEINLHQSDVVYHVLVQRFANEVCFNGGSIDNKIASDNKRKSGVIGDAAIQKLLAA